MRIALNIAAISLCIVAQAHEIGTSRVTAQFQPDRTYRIEIVTDATNLVEKLEAASGRPPVSPTDSQQILEALHANEAAFRRRVSVRFDSESVQPQISYAITPAANPTSAIAATIRLTGTLPASAQNFYWSYGWTYASYALTAQKTGDPETQWLEGDQRSKPIALAEITRSNRVDTIVRYLILGFTHIVPHGLDHMLFVLGIYLLSNRAKSVLLQVSAFTIAHSITLGLSMYGIVDAPSRIVEPVIAISIAYVAIENLFLADLKP